MDRNTLSLWIKQLIGILKSQKIFLIFLCSMAVIIAYVFVYNKLLLQNIFGAYLGAPLAITGEFLIVSFLASMSLIFSEKMKKIYLSCLFVLISTIYIVVLLYFREFNYFPTINLIFLATHKGNVLGDVMDVIISLFKLSDLIFIFIFILWIILSQLNQEVKIKFNKRIKICLAALFIFGFAFFFYKTCFNLIYKQYSPWHQKIRPNPNLIISHIGLLPFYLEDGLTLYNISKANQKKLNLKEETLISDYLKSNKRHKNKYTGVFKNFNLILIQFESLSNIVINRKINGHEITPMLNRLIHEGMYFSEFYTQEGAGPTTSSEFVTLNSLIAPIDSFVAIQYRFNTFHTLASLFKAKQYYTFALHGNDGSYYNREFIYRQYMFDRFFCKKDIQGQTLHRWISDRDLLRKTANEASRVKPPYFGFPIMVTSHKNWDIVPELGFDTGAHFFKGRAEGYVKNIHYSDQAVEMFFHKLKESGLLKKTIIMIYGDHSPKLKEDEIGSILNIELSKSESQRMRVRIPFLIWAPKGIMQPGIFDEVFPQIDLFPTIANFFDLGNGFGIGKDYFDTRNKHVACTREYMITKFKTYPSNSTSPSKLKIKNEDKNLYKTTKTLCDSQFKISDLILKGDAVKTLSLKSNSF